MGTAQVNGWYHRRKNAEGPSRGRTREGCIQTTAGRLVTGVWFEKDDGYYIYCQSQTNYNVWWCVAPHTRPAEFRDSLLYYAESASALPPAAGWVVAHRG